MEETTEKKPEQKWLPLEANPDVWNDIVHKLGVSPKWNYTDVYEKYEKFKEQEEAKLTKLEQNISPNVVFFKQTISNACGMIALLHSLANNDDDIIGPGLLHELIEKSRSMSPDERAELLENSKELAKVHQLAANDGQTQAPSLDEDINLHFICFVDVDQHLYELDGRKLFPINHGKCTDLVEGAVKFMKQYMERDPDQSNYSAIALCKTD
ncbi:uncharacterized protein BYT42DRAFT_406984 [Radiomyces spectabilis]|uniref:uncharacterized protein n=1 Tax=Radiomyces spectabilis TaxID=64574 RepID=UPI00221E57C9|nr:uncharacterized protein BYT42DRAFT_406984 [Radiomyces spectabilis]KAI8374502.1 hypothetical protein BYT42DRAFT_406984 [Radiomyces spectabilis]